MGPELLEQLHVSLINTATNLMQSLSSANSKESEANLKKSAQRSERETWRKFTKIKVGRSKPLRSS